jgi:hypothetical protein
VELEHLWSRPSAEAERRSIEELRVMEASFDIDVNTVLSRASSKRRSGRDGRGDVLRMQTYWPEEAMADGGDVVTQGIGGGMRSQ